MTFTGSSLADFGGALGRTGLTEEEIRQLAEDLWRNSHDEDGEGIFVGVDDDYSAPVFIPPPTAGELADIGATHGAFTGRTRDVPPRYTNEDEPWVYDFRGGDSNVTLTRQIDLVNGGWLNEDDIGQWGIWGSAEADAMRDIMIEGNQTGRTWEQVLVGSVAARELSERRDASRRRGSGRGRAVPAFRVSNPADLRLTFRSVATQRNGGVFVDEEAISRMVSAYQAEERAAQQRALRGGTVVTAPSPEAFAIEEFEELDPQGAEANRFAGMASVLEELVSSGAI